LWARQPLRGISFSVREKAMDLFLLLVRCALWEARDRDILEDEGREGKRRTYLWCCTDAMYSNISTWNGVRGRCPSYTKNNKPI